MFRLENKSFRNIDINWGYGQFSEFIFYNHYSRIKNNGKNEDWYDCVERNINGVLTIRKNHYLNNNIAWDELYWQTYAQNMACSMLRMEWLPPGRGLWAMGTPLIYKKGAMPLYNCAASLANTPTDFGFIFDLLMYGVGVGFKAERNNLELHKPISTLPYTVADSREGWVHSLESLLNAYYYGDYLPVFNYDKIRPKGAPLKTFGGVASGPDPLKLLHTRVKTECEEYLNNNRDEIEFKTNVANMCGVAAIAGNTRRGAQIALGYLDDDVFRYLKNYNKYSYRSEYGWMSNNSVILETKEDFNQLYSISQANIDGADLGYINLKNFKHGRINVKDDSRKDRASLINPCLSGRGYVLTDKGLLTVEELKIDDSIWSESGWTKIINKQRSGVKPVYRYRTSYGYFEGTTDHKVLTNQWKYEVDKTDGIDILRGEVLTSVDHNLQAIVDGFLIGDGSYHFRPLFNIGENDKDLFDSEIKEYIGSQYNKSYNYTALTELTETQIKSHVVPEYYMRHDVCSFLRGLYTANGSVVRNRITLKTAIPKLRDQVQLMLSSIGIRSYYTTNKMKGIFHHNGLYVSKESYDINIVQDAEVFKQLIGFIQKYKLIKIKPSPSEKSNYKTCADIIDKEYLGEFPVYDVTVNNSSHTHWYNNFNVSNCGEIPLEDKEVCNIADTIPTRCKDKATWLKACEYATFYCSTVALLPTHRPETNAKIFKNRRIGVGIMDGIKWKNEIGMSKLVRCLRDGYKTIKRVNKKLAVEAGVPESIRLTTIKPGGTTTKLAGAVQGIGYPTFIYTLRRVNVLKYSPMFRTLLRANIPFIKSPYTDTTVLFEFPIRQDSLSSAEEVSIWEQAFNVILMQREWADNAVSNTLYFSKEEERYLEDVITHIAPLTKSVSLLRHTPKGIFEAMPEEGISKEEYETRLSEIDHIDWSTFNGSDGLDEKYCTKEECIL